MVNIDIPNITCGCIIPQNNAEDAVNNTVNIDNNIVFAEKWWNKPYKTKEET